MTCIEKYNEQKNITNKIISNLNKVKGLTAIGEQDLHNDKYSFNFYDHSLWAGDISVFFMRHMDIGAIVVAIVLVVQKCRSIF